MKRIFFIYTAILCLGSSMLSAQSVSIAVVDMKVALEGFYKTKQQVDEINDLGQEKIRNIDERKASYQKMTSEMVDLDKIVRGSQFSDAKRQEAGKKLEELAQTRVAKANEINDAERRAQQELYDLRQKMEAGLMDEIKAVVVSVGTAKGFDMVFDKSFLPNARKNILYTSPKVTDLTAEVLEKLNSKAPPVN